MDYQFDLVGKIGSMALIRREDNDIDYNIFARLGAELKPGMIWVTSGAAEIGRLDYIKRAGHELTGSPNEVKADYAAQGQSILMQNYRQFVSHTVGVRQLLVEHTHFNDPEKREYIRKLQESCVGASRAGANGAKAKLEFALKSALQGTTVIIGHARHHLSDLTEGRVPCTRVSLL